MRYLFILLSFTLGIASCAVSNPSTQTNELPATNAEKYIVFVVFKIKKGQNNSTVEIISNSKSSGSMKRQVETASDFRNFLTIEISHNNKISKTITMNHPLLKSVEFIDNNGKFRKKEVVLEEDPFFIRFQSMGESTSLSISETVANATKKEIASFKL